MLESGRSTLRIDSRACKKNDRAPVVDEVARKELRGGGFRGREALRRYPELLARQRAQRAELQDLSLRRNVQRRVDLCRCECSHRRG